MLWFQEKNGLENQIKIPRIGIEVSHQKGFVVNRPNGSGDYVFLHFTTPINLLSAVGKKIEAPGSCILYAPPFPQWYTASGPGFNHDWFHADGDAFKRLIQEYSIPLNTVFHSGNSREVTALLSSLFSEVYRKDSYWEKKVLTICEQLCIHIYRATTLKEAGSSRHLRTLLEQFRNVRMKILASPEQRWSVEALAREVCLSRSRFSVLYRQFFGSSPAQEIVNARMQRAVWLLKSTSHSVKKIAQESGFEDVCYFYRIFTKHMGCPPGKYK